MTLEVYAQIDVIADRLAAKGVRLDARFKRRDRNEPGRLAKEALEDRLARAVRKLFLQQRQAVLAAVEASGQQGLGLAVSGVVESEAAQAAMLVTLYEAGKHAVELFAAEVTIGLDLAAYNLLVDEQVRLTIGSLLQGVNATTLEAVRKALQFYAENPGLTLGDLARMLPFDARRAQLIARTEITQLYGEINRLAGEKLAVEYPDVTVVETWHTNRDDLVCPICGGLDGVERAPGQPFIHKETGAEFESSKETHPECRCWTTVRTSILRPKA